MTNSTSVPLQHSNPAADFPHKRRRRSHHHHRALLPGLPDDVANLCLSRVPPSILFSVSHSWRRLIYSPQFPPFLSIYALFLPSQTLPNLPISIHFSSFDPISFTWKPLPDPPSDPPLRLLYQHPSFISRKLPIQSVTVSGNLVLLAATVDQFLPALSRPLIFNPRSQKWSYGPQFCSPRRWCISGTSRGSIYIASGIGSHYDNDVARSIEKWNPNNEKRWEETSRLRDAKFSREAIDAVGWKGKLCMVNVKGDAAKEGIIYDVEKEEWEEMPDGMLGGWRGPAAAMEEETIYGVDESKGVMKRYDEGKDRWVEVVEKEVLKGAQQVTAGGGRVCVLCADGVSIAVVDVETASPTVWMVTAPPGVQAVGIHVLPRLWR